MTCSHVHILVYSLGTQSECSHVTENLSTHITSHYVHLHVDHFVSPQVQDGIPHDLAKLYCVWYIRYNIHCNITLSSYKAGLSVKVFLQTFYSLCVTHNYCMT